MEGQFFLPNTLSIVIHDYRAMKKKYAAGSSAVVDPNKVVSAAEKAAKTASFVEQPKNSTFMEQNQTVSNVTDTLVTKAMALAAKHIADQIDSDEAGVIFTQDMDITTHTNEDQTSEENIDQDESSTNITGKSN